MAALPYEKTFRRALCPGGDVFRVGGAGCEPDASAVGDVLDRLERLLGRTAFAMPPERWLALTDEPALVAWSGRRETVAAELIDRVVAWGWQGAGACETAPLPPLEAAGLNHAMADADYVRAPRWAGACRETSSLTRTDSPLLRELERNYGNGLLVRLVARLTELAVLAGRLAEAHGGERAGPPGAGPVNPGTGQVEAARGRLVHRVGLHGDRVHSYQILAPTEWNFHPEGVVARALSALSGDTGRIERQARLLINAIDPCVGYELQIVEECSGGA